MVTLEKQREYIYIHSVRASIVLRTLHYGSHYIDEHVPKIYQCKPMYMLRFIFTEHVSLVFRTVYFLVLMSQSCYIVSLFPLPLHYVLPDLIALIYH